MSNDNKVDAGRKSLQEAGLYIAEFIRFLREQGHIKGFALSLVRIRTSGVDREEVFKEPTWMANALSETLGLDITDPHIQAGIQHATDSTDPVAFDGRRAYTKEYFELRREKAQRYRHAARVMAIEQRTARRTVERPERPAGTGPNETTARTDSRPRRESDPPPWLMRLLASPRYREQGTSERGRGLTSQDDLVCLLTALTVHRGSVTVVALARELDIQLARAYAFLSAAQRVVNIDGQGVLEVNEDAGTVHFDQELLEQQFGLKP